MVTLTIAPPGPMLLREAGSRRGRLQGTDGRMINRRTGSGKRARNPAGSRFKPGEPKKLLGHQPEIESPLVGMAGHAPKPLGERLRVAVRASRTNFRAASDRIPRRVGPFDLGFLAHRRSPSFAGRRPSRGSLFLIAFINELKEYVCKAANNLALSR